MNLLRALWETMKELKIGDKVYILHALFGVLFGVCGIFEFIIPTITFGLIFFISAMFMIYAILKI